MAIARKLAGYTLGGADILRRAMGKKKKEETGQAVRAMFSSGMKDNGYSDEATQAVWDVLLPFSAYAFNKSHTAGYGLVSYWTAYLKANYPAEYMAALLTSVGTNKDKMARLPGRDPPDGRQGAAAGRQRVAAAGSPPSATTSGSASARSATSARTWSTAIISARGVQGPVRQLPRLPDQGRRSPSATSGSSNRWSRPAPSTAWGTRARA